jgi:ethanolamine utilization microcompartment shell protein EutL
LIFQAFIPNILSAFAQEVITILSGSTDKNRPRFLDITFYPIEKGKELTWFNDDDVEHSIVINSITEDNKTKLLTELKL